jgi:ribosomal protein S12
MASKNNGLFECPKQDGITIEANAINALDLNEALRKLVELVGERSDFCYFQVFFSAVS